MIQYQLVNNYKEIVKDRIRSILEKSIQTVKQ